MTGHNTERDDGVALGLDARREECSGECRPEWRQVQSVSAFSPPVAVSPVAALILCELLLLLLLLLMVLMLLREEGLIHVVHVIHVLLMLLDLLVVVHALPAHVRISGHALWLESRASYAAAGACRDCLDHRHQRKHLMTLYEVHLVLRASHLHSDAARTLHSVLRRPVAVRDAASVPYGSRLPPPPRRGCISIVMPFVGVT